MYLLFDEISSLILVRERQAVEPFFHGREARVDSSNGSNHGVKSRYHDER